MVLHLCRRHLVDPRRAAVTLYCVDGLPEISFIDDRFHQILVHRSLSEGPRTPAWSLRFGSPRLHPFCLCASGSATAVVASAVRVLFLRRCSVPSLAPFFGSSALRSAAITRLPRYFGLC